MGISAFGTTLTIATDTIAELTNISGPGVSADTVDITSHQSWLQHPAIGTFTTTNAQNRIDVAGHGLPNGAKLRFSTTNTLPDGYETATVYYVVNANVDDFQVSLEPGGAVVTIDDDGTGDHSYHSADSYREDAGGMIDGGEVSVEGNLTTAAAGNALVGYLEAGGPETCVIAFPNGVEWTFDGIVTAFNTETPYEDKQSFSATIKVTGRPVLA